MSLVKQRDQTFKTLTYNMGLNAGDFILFSRVEFVSMLACVHACVSVRMLWNTSSQGRALGVSSLRRADWS